MRKYKFEPLLAFLQWTQCAKICTSFCLVRSSCSSRRSENVATVSVLEADGLNCSCRLREQSGIETFSYLLRRVSERGRIVGVDERSRALSQQSSIRIRPGVGQCLQKSGGRTECAPTQKSEKIHNGVEDAHEAWQAAGVWRPETVVKIRSTPTQAERFMLGGEEKNNNNNNATIGPASSSWNARGFSTAEFKSLQKTLAAWSRLWQRQKLTRKCRVQTTARRLRTAHRQGWED